MAEISRTEAFVCVLAGELRGPNGLSRAGTADRCARSPGRRRRAAVLVRAGVEDDDAVPNEREEWEEAVREVLQQMKDGTLSPLTAAAESGDPKTTDRAVVDAIQQMGEETIREIAEETRRSMEEEVMARAAQTGDEIEQEALRRMDEQRELLMKDVIDNRDAIATEVDNIKRLSEEYSTATTQRAGDKESLGTRMLPTLAAAFLVASVLQTAQTLSQPADDGSLNAAVTTGAVGAVCVALYRQRLAKKQ